MNYPVEHGKVVIPLELADSIDPADLRLWMMACPNDGFHLLKKGDKYQIIQKVRYAYTDTLQPELRSYNTSEKQEWYLIPNEHFEGPDSTYYYARFKQFLKDSCGP